MIPSIISQSLEVALDVDIPVIVWGKPGVGKSQTIIQLGKKRGIPVQDVRLSQLDPVDLRGVPYKDENGFTCWAVPSFLPNAERDGEEGILFLDEINKATNLVQSAAYQLILDRKLGDYVMPAGWRIIAAGNNLSDKAYVTKMSSALANRFIHYDYEEHVPDFVDWGLANDIDEDVISFIQFRPDLLHDMDTSSELKAFPTPRTWEYVSDLKKANPANLTELIKSTVGQGTSIEFAAYLTVFATLPTTADMINNPGSIDLSDNNSDGRLYALASKIAKEIDASNIAPLFSIVERMSIEFQVYVVKRISLRNKVLTSAPQIVQWILRNPEIFKVGK